MVSFPWTPLSLRLDCQGLYTPTQLSLKRNNFLHLLFVALKLTGYISWPWLLVLLPTIIDFALFLLYVGFCLSILNLDSDFPRLYRGRRRR